MVICEQGIVYQDSFLQNARCLQRAINQDPLMQKAFSLFAAYTQKDIEVQVISEEFERINTIPRALLQEDEKIDICTRIDSVQWSLRLSIKKKYEEGLRIFGELVKQPEFTEPYAHIQEQFYRIVRQNQEETNSISENYLYDIALLGFLLRQ